MFLSQTHRRMTTLRQWFQPPFTPPMHIPSPPDVKNDMFSTRMSIELRSANA
jgi:hypothetical protein